MQTCRQTGLRRSKDAKGFSLRLCSFFSLRETSFISFLYSQMKFPLLIGCFLLAFSFTRAQWNRKNADSLFQPLPASVHVYMTNDPTEGKPNIAYYVSAELKDKSLDFTTQTGNGKRYTPTRYFEQEQKLLLGMNTIGKN